jgi:hypothetical protein
MISFGTRVCSSRTLNVLGVAGHSTRDGANYRLSTILHGCASVLRTMGRTMSNRSADGDGQPGREHVTPSQKQLFVPRVGVAGAINGSGAKAGGLLIGFVP